MKQRQVVTQKITTAPTTVVAAKILQCGTDELYEFIDSLVQENPVVDMDSASRQEQSLMYTRKVDWLRRQSAAERRRAYSGDSDQDGDYTNEMWDQHGEAKDTLPQMLMLQVKAMKLLPEQERIARYIVDSLDGDGFISENLEAIAARLEARMSDVVDVLELLQTQLEPAGACAFDSRSALCLQVDRLKGDPLAKRIIKEQLESVAKDRTGAIACALKQPAKRVAACCELIKTLNPFPCRSLTQEDSTCYIYNPDIVVSVEDGIIRAEVAESASPRIIMNSYYINLRERSTDQEVNAYLDDKIQQAQWVQRCIARRRDMLGSLAQLLIDRQADFFIYGAERLHPLAMADAAKELGVHESTVSRAVKGKYLQCVHGLFPLNYFFPGAINVGGTQSLSNHQIKAQIKRIIDSEDKSAPLNDRIIADILEDMGMNVSRRTVAKYRDAMGIDPASKRTKTG